MLGPADLPSQACPPWRAGNRARRTVKTITISYDTLAQLAHVGWGAMLVFIVALLILPWWAAALLVSAAGAVKEFVVERFIEDTHTQGSALRDFLFWCVGVAVAVIVLLLRR